MFNIKNNFYRITTKININYSSIYTLIQPLLILNTCHPFLFIFLLHFLYHLNFTSTILFYELINHIFQTFMIIIKLLSIFIYDYLLNKLITIHFFNLAMIFEPLNLEDSLCTLLFEKYLYDAYYSMILIQSFLIFISMKAVI